MNSVLLVAALIAVASAALDKETLRAHCRQLTIYTSGPGSLEDSLNRWNFYMNDHGDYTVPGSSVVKKTKEEWKAGTIAAFDQYKTFNHVYHPEEPEVNDNTCIMDVYHAFLAWDGRCGPLIFKEEVTLKIDPAATSADKANVVAFSTFFDKEGLIAQIESCGPGSEEGTDTKA